MLIGRLLIIDDSKEDRELLGRILGRSDEVDQIVLASSGATGVDLFAGEKADAVILDYNLPGEDCITVLQDIRALDPFCPVIILTGDDNQAIAQNAADHGATAFFLKGHVPSFELLATIFSALASSAEQREAVHHVREFDVFLGKLFHDIKAPLRHIETRSEFIEEDIGADLTPDVRAHLDTIQRSVERLQDLVGKAAYYSRLTATKLLEPVSLNGVLAEAKMEVSALLKESGGEVQGTDLPDVYGDFELIVEMFKHLIDNAIRYNQASPPTMTVSAQGSRPGFVQIVFSDNAIPIPADRREYVFKPLMRLWSNDDYPGTGLGLAICQRIADLHNGEIVIETSPEGGNTFSVSLPTRPGNA